MKNTTVYTGLIVIMCIMPVFIMGSASRCLADSMIDIVLEDWHPAEIIGTIMSVDTDSDTVVVNEVKIYIANTRAKNGKKCTTKIMNGEGRETGRPALKKGKFVYVKAGTAHVPEEGIEYIVAKEIYVMPHVMSKKDLKNRKIATGQNSSW